AVYWISACQLALQLDELLFALYTPAVAGDAAVATQHTMAGHDNRQRVGCTGAGYGAHCSWFAKPSSQLGIADGLPGRDLGQFAPDLLLKVAAEGVERLLHLQPPQGLIHIAQ